MVREGANLDKKPAMERTDILLVNPDAPKQERVWSIRGLEHSEQQSEWRGIKKKSWRDNRGPYQARHGMSRQVTGI